MTATVRSRRVSVARYSGGGSISSHTRLSPRPYRPRRGHHYPRRAGTSRLEPVPWPSQHGEPPCRTGLRLSRRHGCRGRYRRPVSARDPHFIIATHPDLDNIWLARGSAEAFKSGPGSPNTSPTGRPTTTPSPTSPTASASKKRCSSRSSFDSAGLTAQPWAIPNADLLASRRGSAHSSNRAGTPHARRSGPAARSHSDAEPPEAGEFQGVA